MTEQKLEQYWTVPQVAERLHCSIDSVKKWLGKGELKKTKAGARTLVAETHLQEYLRLCTERAA